MPKQFIITFIQPDESEKSFSTIDIPDDIVLNTTDIDKFIMGYTIYLSNRVSLEVESPTINDALNSLAQVEFFENFIKKYKTSNSKIDIGY